MTSVERLAREYFAAREVSPAHLKRELARLVTEDFLWQASGYPDVRGKAAVLALVDEQSATNYHHSDIEILKIACGADFALTERVDILYDKTGAVIASVKLMGRLDVRDGKISLHRDYFDPATH
jgi:limonene-1,2-epoxide hydrolase